MPRVAVHIVTFNSAQVIAHCLDALLAQDGDFSTLVIDNASNDDTVSLIRRYNVPLEVLASNVGYAAAHNRALDKTSSDFVLTLNPDVVLQPGYLAHMVQKLDEHPNLGSAAGCLLRVDRLGETPYAIDSIGLFMRRSRRQGLLLENEAVSHAPQVSRLIFGPDGAAAFYRRDMLEDIAVEGEVFDEDFFMHKEDVDLCWRAQLAGWASAYVPAAIAHHIRTFRPNRRERVDRFLRMCAVRNRYLLMLKNDIARLFARDLFRIACYDVLAFGYILLREPASLRGLASVWALRRRMSHKRRIIQARRRASVETISGLFV